MPSNNLLKAISMYKQALDPGVLRQDEWDPEMARSGGQSYDRYGRSESGYIPEEDLMKRLPTPFYHPWEIAGNTANSFGGAVGTLATGGTAIVADTLNHLAPAGSAMDRHTAAWTDSMSDAMMAHATTATDFLNPDKYSLFNPPNYEYAPTGRGHIWEERQTNPKYDRVHNTPTANDAWMLENARDKGSYVAGMYGTDLVPETVLFAAAGMGWPLQAAKAAKNAEKVRMWRKLYPLAFEGSLEAAAYLGASEHYGDQWDQHKAQQAHELSIQHERGSDPSTILSKLTPRELFEQDLARHIEVAPYFQRYQQNPDAEQWSSPESIEWINAFYARHNKFLGMLPESAEEWAQLQQRDPAMYERTIELYNYIITSDYEKKPKPYGRLLQAPPEEPNGQQRYRDAAPPAVQGPQDYGQQEKGAAETTPPLRPTPTPTLPTSTDILGIVGPLFPPIQSWIDSLTPEYRGQINSGINYFLTNTFGGGGGGGAQKPSAVKPSGAYGLKDEIPNVYKPKVKSVDRYAGDMT